ncbi:MAG: GAF domain-containing protein [Fimbriimonadaceae bacterium]|nr:GAF domain-containing protein [Fimbriimonadaceae bacterium]
MTQSHRSGLAMAIASGSSERRALAGAAEWIAGELKADNVAILLPSPTGGLELRAYHPSSSSIEHLVLGRGVGLVGYVAETGETVSIQHGLSNDPRHVIVPVLDDSGHESAIAAPLRIGGPHAGVLMIRRRKEWPEAPSLEGYVNALADDLSCALSVYRTAFEAGSQSNVAATLAELADTVSGAPYLEEILDQLVQITARRFNYPVVTLRLLDSQREWLVLRATHAPDLSVPREPMIRIGESIAGRVAQLGKTEFVEDVLQSKDYIGHAGAIEHGVRSMVCVPLDVNGRISGVMSCYAGEVRQFPPEEIQAVEALAKQAAVSIEHGRLQARDTLLQEMHHRVKNNLQQVASLVRIELNRRGGKTTQESLSDTLARIEAIAAVHELLSRDDLDHVSLTSVANTLAAAQQQSLLPPGKSVNFHVKGGDVFVDTSRATQVALVINELIQNAVKHGFKVTDSGDVHVSIEAQSEIVGIWVSNNGDKLEPERLKDSLGIQIIEGLARALGGEFSLGEKLGWTVAHLKFPRTGRT